MKSYLLKRIKYYLSILFVGIVISWIVNKKILIDLSNYEFLIWIGFGFLISEVLLFIDWRKEQKSTNRG